MSNKYTFLLMISTVLASCALNTVGSYPSDTTEIPDFNDVDPPRDDGSDSGCITHEQCDDGDPCNGSEYCDIEQTCRSGPPLADGAVCGAEPRQICLDRRCVGSICGDGFTDAGAGEQCDDANLIPDDGCDNSCQAGSTCTTDIQCDDGHDCTFDRCDLDLGACINAPKPSGVVCREAAHQCDAEELCDGSASDCPPDQGKAEGEACDDGNPCTAPDACSDVGTCLSTITDILHDAVSVAAGGFHTCALLRQGIVLCWGANESGQLGDGTTTEKHFPGEVVGLSDINRVFCGYNHSCALADDGRINCWGNNEQGQLGIGSNINSFLPVDIAAISGAVVSISAGNNHTCAVTAAGETFCWGANSSGQLGNGTTTASNLPVAVVGLSAAATSIAAGGYHTCALLDTGEVQCWGSNLAGQLGNGTTTASPLPVGVTALPWDATEIRLGLMHSCSMHTTGEIRCWGQNQYGQLGSGTTTSSSSPVNVTGMTNATRLATGGSQTCALTTVSSEVKCWGRNDLGQLGDGTTTNRTLPTLILDTTSGKTDVAVGGYHACLALDSETLKCWGFNNAGQLGNSTTTDSLTPTDVKCE